MTIALTGAFESGQGKDFPLKLLHKFFSPKGMVVDGNGEQTSMMLPKEAIELIRQSVSLLVHKQWGPLLRMGACERVTPSDIERVLSENEIQLVEHPADRFEISMDISSTHDDGIWLVDLDLWGTKGATDLTLKLRVTQAANSRFDILIGDLRVL